MNKIENDLFLTLENNDQDFYEKLKREYKYLENEISLPFMVLTIEDGIRTKDFLKDFEGKEIDVIKVAKELIKRFE